MPRYNISNRYTIPYATRLQNDLNDLKRIATKGETSISDVEASTSTQVKMIDGITAVAQAPFVVAGKAVPFLFDYDFLKPDPLSDIRARHINNKNQSVAKFKKLINLQTGDVLSATKHDLRESFGDFKASIKYLNLTRDIEAKLGASSPLQKQTIAHEISEAFYDVSIATAKQTEKNGKNIGNLAHQLNSIKTNELKDIKNGLSLLTQENKTLACQLAKEAGFTQDEIKKINTGQFLLSDKSTKIENHINKLKKTVTNYTKQQQAQKSTALEKQKRQADYQSRMQALALVGSFGQMIDSKALVVTAHIAATIMNVSNAAQAIAVTALSGALNPMIAIGQGMLGLIQLFSEPQPDPVMEYLKALSKNLNSLRKEVHKGFSELSAGQKQIFMRMCRGFTEVISTINGSEQRLTDLITQRLDKISADLQLHHQQISRSLLYSNTVQLNRLHHDYNALPNLAGRLEEKAKNNLLSKDFEKLMLWVSKDCANSEFNGMKVAQPTSSTAICTPKQFIYATNNHTSSLDMLALLVGYIKVNTDLAYAESGAYKKLANHTLWLSASSSMSRLLAAAPQQFLENNKATINVGIQEAIRTGRSLKAGLKAVNSNQLMAALTIKYREELANAKQLFTALVSASNQGQLFQLTDSIANKANALPALWLKFPRTDEKIKASIPGLFSWARSLNVGQLKHSPLQDLGRHEHASRAPNENSKITIYRGYAKSLSFTHRNTGEKNTLIKLRIAYHKSFAPLTNYEDSSYTLLDERPENIQHYYDMNFNKFMRESGVGPYSIISIGSASARSFPMKEINTSRIESIKQDIMNAAISKQNTLKIRTASKIVEGTSNGANLNKSLERLEALRLCLHALLEINDRLPADATKQNFLLSQAKMLMPFRQVITTQGASAFPATLAGNFNLNSIDTLPANFQGAHLQPEQMTPDLSTLESMLYRLEITSEHIDRTTQGRNGPALQTQISPQTAGFFSAKMPSLSVTNAIMFLTMLFFLMKIFSSSEGDHSNENEGAAPHSYEPL